MSENEFVELQEALNSSGYGNNHNIDTSTPCCNEAYAEKEAEKDDLKVGVCQYIFTGEGYIPSSNTVLKLPAGSYTLEMTQRGIMYLPQTVVTDKLMRLPDSRSEEIIREVEKFWQPETRKRFEKFGLIYKRGFLLWGPAGCHAAGTKILMFDGTLKKIEDIVLGDQVMGPDSEPREVLKLCRGREKMYRIIPTNKNRGSDPFIVNGQHILSLQQTNNIWGFRGTINISVKDFLNQTKAFQRSYKLYKTSKIDFKVKKDLPIPPYILGLWLGDGSTNQPELTTMDPEIRDVWINYVKSLGLDIRVDSQKHNKSSTYIATSHKNFEKNANTLTNLLRNLGV